MKEKSEACDSPFSICSEPCWAKRFFCGDWVGVCLKFNFLGDYSSGFEKKIQVNQLGENLRLFNMYFFLQLPTHWNQNIQ